MVCDQEFQSFLKMDASRFFNIHDKDGDGFISKTVRARAVIGEGMSMHGIDSIACLCACLYRKSSIDLCVYENGNPRALTQIYMQEYYNNNDAGIFSFGDLFVYDRVCDQGLVMSDESIITRR